MQTLTLHTKTVQKNFAHKQNKKYKYPSTTQTLHELVFKLAKRNPKPNHYPNKKHHRINKTKD